MSNGEKHIDIVYCTDEKFVPVCAASITSVLENQGEESITFYIIDNHISQSSRKLFRNILQKYPRNTIEFEPFPDLNRLFDFGLRYEKEHVSISAFGRLFVSSVLPEKLGRIIYLDCDTIVLGSLRQLYSYEMNDKIIGGVDDCKSIRYRQVLGLNSEDNYINSGVLLIDMEGWRKEKCERKIMTFIERHRGKIHFEDQGVINGALNGYIGLLPMQYNVMSHNFDMSFVELMAYRKPLYSYTREMIEYAKNNPVIIHYTTSFLTYGRVWNGNCNHKRKAVFDEYAKKAGVYEKFEIYIDPLKKRMKSKIIQKLPRAFVITLAGFVHEWIEPVKYAAIMRSDRREEK